MIEWFQPPYTGTNKADGFEIVIHGLVDQQLGRGLEVIIVNEEGVMGLAKLSDVAMEWRYTRGRGWHNVDETEDQPRPVFEPAT